MMKEFHKLEDVSSVFFGMPRIRTSSSSLGIFSEGFQDLPQPCSRFCGVFSINRAKRKKKKG